MKHAYCFGWQNGSDAKISHSKTGEEIVGGASHLWEPDNRSDNQYITWNRVNCKRNRKAKFYIKFSQMEVLNLFFNPYVDGFNYCYKYDPDLTFLCLTKNS